MGFFDFVGEVIAAPIRLTANVASTTIKVAGHALTADFDAVETDVKKSVEEAAETLEKVVDSATKDS